MKQHDNDNELSFIHIAAATANALRFLNLNEQEPNPRKNEPNPSEDAGKSVDLNRAFIEHRLRELADWERRIREDRLRYRNWKKT